MSMLEVKTKTVSKLNEKEIVFLVAYHFGGMELFQAFDYARRANVMIAVKKFDLQNFIYSTDFYLQNLSPNTGSNNWKVSNRLGETTTYLTTSDDGVSEAICKAAVIALKNTDYCSIPICSVLQNN